jgi:hypothetical protein
MTLNIQKLMSILLVSCLFLVAATLNSYMIIKYFDPFDEGMILFSAERVLRGYKPHVDFWSGYPPGQYYTVASLFKLFGISALVERIYDLIVKSLISILVYLVTFKLVRSRTSAFLGWMMSIPWLIIGHFNGYPIFPTILFIYLGIFAYLIYLEKNNNRYLIFSALFVTISATFRHDLGGLAAFAFLVALLLRRILHKSSDAGGIYYFSFTMIVAGAIISGYLINDIGLRYLADDLIFFPSGTMPKYRWLPYPTSLSLSTGLFYVFPLILFYGLITSLKLIMKNKDQHIIGYGMLLLSLIGILFINQVRVRSDLVHLVPSGIFSLTLIPVFSYILLSLRHKITNPKILTGTVLILLIGICITLGVLANRESRPYFRNFWHLNFWQEQYYSGIKRAGYCTMGADLLGVVRYIRNNTDVNDAIYVGLTNHDQFTINDVIIYFLSGRRCATKYHQMEPGVTTTQETQKEIVAEIEEASVKLIVLKSNYWPEPNDTRIDLKIDIIDNYIASNYGMTKKFDEYEIWEPL